MADGVKGSGSRGERHDAAHLPEDAYLTDFLGAMALDAALSMGIIDGLAGQGAVAPRDLALEPPSGAVLLGLLAAAGVCEPADKLGERYRLTAEFAAVLRGRRGILEQKLFFLRLAARDLLDGFPDLLSDLPKFMQRSRTFALFRYDKALHTDPDSLAHTRRWTDYVTALTEAEGEVLIPEIDLSGHHRLLEIGGNTGAFALGLLQAYPALRATVLDLPAVCRLGRDYARGRAGAERLAFVPGDARADTWPAVHGQPADVILFKSVLHDWPEVDAGAMLDRAQGVLAPGGRLIVCERGPLADEFNAAQGAPAMPYSMAANLVFCRFYREPAFYEQALRRRGFSNIQTRPVRLEMTFNIVTATKPDGGP